MPKIYDSLEEFEKEWKEELEKLTEVEPEVEPEVETEVDETDANETDDEDTNEVDETEEDATTEETPKVEGDGDDVIEPLKTEKKPKTQIETGDKVAHSFQKLREAEKLQREKAEKLEQELKDLDNTALKLGYSNYAEFKKAIDEKALKDEATKLGKDPEVYKELNELKKRQAELEREREEVTRKQREEQVYKQMGEFIQENNLSEAEFSKVIELAANDGVTADDFMSLKGIKSYLKGVASDLLYEKKKQKDLAKSAKKQTLSQEKHTQTTPPPKNKSIEEIAREEVEAEYGIKRGK